MQAKYSVSERRICLLFGISRSVQRYQHKAKSYDETDLRQAILQLSEDRPRFGYRRITAMLRNNGYVINHKKVLRIWREEGLLVPPRKGKRTKFHQPIQKKPVAKYQNHVWAYDFMKDSLINGKSYKILTIIDEHTRLCLGVKVAKSIKAMDVIDMMADLFLEYGFPAYVRSDNGPEFTAKKLKSWLESHKVNAEFIKPASPWQNGFNESFNSKISDELITDEIFRSILEANVMIQNWRDDYNNVRPHSALNYKTPAQVANHIPFRN